MRCLCPLPSSSHPPPTEGQTAHHRTAARRHPHRPLGIRDASRSLALLAAVPVMWGWGLNWVDVVLFVVFYSIGAAGIGVGFHRYLTHGSFKAKRWLRITLAVAGSIAIEGLTHPVGGRPPAAPPVQRHGGRPALAVAVRRDVLGPDQGTVVLARRLAVPPRDVQPGAVRAGPRGRQGHPGRGPALPVDRGRARPRCRRSSAAWRPGPGRARCPPSSGPAWSGSRCCTTSPGRSTRSATCMASARSTAGTRRPTSGRWRCCRSVRTGTTCTTPTRPAPATAFCAVRST